MQSDYLDFGKEDNRSIISNVFFLRKEFSTSMWAPFLKSTAWITALNGSIPEALYSSFQPRSSVVVIRALLWWNCWGMENRLETGVWERDYWRVAWGSTEIFELWLVDCLSQPGALLGWIINAINQTFEKKGEGAHCVLPTYLKLIG